MWYFLYLYNSDPLLIGAVIATCFPSIAPNRWGKFYFSLNNNDIFFHLLTVRENSNKKSLFQVNIEELSDTAIKSNENPRSEELPISTPTNTTSTDIKCTRPLKRNSEAALTKDVLLSFQNHFKRPTLKMIDMTFSVKEQH